MSTTYQIEDNVLRHFVGGMSYLGFENGSDDQIITPDITLCGQTIRPGDKIKGFDSGKTRSSCIVTRGYLQYVGVYKYDVLFENVDPLYPKNPLAPRWLLAFGWSDNMDRLYVLSSLHTAWDIVPTKVIPATNH